MSGYCFCSLATKLVEEHPNCRQVAQVKKKKIRYFLPDIPSASSSGLKGCPFFFFCQWSHSSYNDQWKKCFLTSSSFFSILFLLCIVDNSSSTHLDLGSGSRHYLGFWKLNQLLPHANSFLVFIKDVEKVPKYHQSSEVQDASSIGTNATPHHSRCRLSNKVPKRARLPLCSSVWRIWCPWFSKISDLLDHRTVFHFASVYFKWDWHQRRM